MTPFIHSYDWSESRFCARFGSWHFTLSIDNPKRYKAGVERFSRTSLRKPRVHAPPRWNRWTSSCYLQQFLPAFLPIMMMVVNIQGRRRGWSGMAVSGEFCAGNKGRSWKKLAVSLQWFLISDLLICWNCLQFFSSHSLHYPYWGGEILVHQSPIWLQHHFKTMRRAATLLLLFIAAYRLNKARNRYDKIRLRNNVRITGAKMGLAILVLLWALLDAAQNRDSRGV